MAEQVAMDDLHIHGGVVQQVTCMGDVYMHGGLVNTMEVQGDCKQSGGVINRRIRQQKQSDDILISKIHWLENQLTKEREAHQKEIDELEWRLEAVTEIANGRNKRIYEDETNGHYIGVTDDSFDVLFTLINEYPISNDVDMAEELGISVSTLRYIAKVLRLAKSPEARREARERLKRHGIEMIERRGGDQTKDKRQKKTKH